MAERARRAGTGKKRLDIRDVALHAKVSIATVSRTINRVPSVDKELARRVWKSIEKLNYYPNTQARALVSGRSRIFGLLISEITNPFFPELVQGFDDVAVEHGYDVMISATNYDPARMEICIRRLLERNVDGVAVITFGVETPFLNQLTARNIPLVLIDLAPPGEHVHKLAIDYRHGIRQGVQHLAALGHRRIAFVSGPLQQLSCQLRKNAFASSVEEIGLQAEPDLLLEGDHTLEGGMQAADALMQNTDLPTAVMCSNDMTAIGVLRTFHRAGLRVPEDVSVIGFDNIHMAEFIYPPLTTVNMSRVEIARAAFDALRAEVEGVHSSAARKVISTTLVVRQSTSFPRGSLEGLKSPAGSAETPRLRKRRRDSGAGTAELTPN